jgi:hypothetical protein
MPETLPLPIGSQRIPISPEQWTHDVRKLFAVYEGEEGRNNGSKYALLAWVLKTVRMPLEDIKG